jgi:hypothetical protein
VDKISEVTTFSCNDPSGSSGNFWYMPASDRDHRGPYDSKGKRLSKIAVAFSGALSKHMFFRGEDDISYMLKPKRYNIAKKGFTEGCWPKTP